MARVREPAVAGTFYPSVPARLEHVVRDHLGWPQSPVREHPKALIAPHAGFVYSGPVAGSAFMTVFGSSPAVERVVLLGPAHTVAFEGLAMPECDAFRTPLGDVPVDHDAPAALVESGRLLADDRPHRWEHSLEVELPFLQVAVASCRLVPIVVGAADPREVEEVLAHLWGGDETLVVVSSDLSHHLPYAEAARLDAETARAVEELRPEAIGPGQACGRIPLCGLLLAARSRGLSARTLDLRNSGDTAGDRESVVGYGAFALG